MKRLLIVLLCHLVLLIVPFSASADLDVYYLDVGQADAIFVICDGHSMLIDGGNPEDSSYIFSFLSKTVKTDVLDYVVATHPHNDHIGGLPAAFKACQVTTLFTPVQEYDSRPFKSILRFAEDQGTCIVSPGVLDCYPLGSAEITFLSPGCASDDPNDLSLVVRIVYGNTSFLFMGDSTFRVEHDILNLGVDITSDVLKVGHHGSSTSTSTDFLAAVYPRYAVISVGRGNTYGHPVADTMSFLEYYGVYVYRTDLDGTILCHSNGFDIDFITEKEVEDDYLRYQAQATPSPAPLSDDAMYIGNKKSMKFHYPTCNGVAKMSEKNKVSLASRDEAISLGYLPCGTCKP